LLAPEETKIATLLNFEQLNREGHWEGEYTVRRKDGSTIPVHITNTYLKDAAGDNIGFIGISEDIREQQKARAALLASEERFRRSLDDMLEGCMIIDRDWNYIYLNDTSAKHGHAKREELLGKNMLQMYPGVEQTELFSHYRECMEKCIPQHFESSYIFPDSGIEWFELSVQSASEGIFVLSIDITERKNAELALEKARSELEERVLERTAELNKSNEALQKALKSRDEFLAAVSHELRTPLTAILGMAEILQLKGASSMTEKQLESIGSINKSGKRLLEVVNDVLDYSRLQSGSARVFVTTCSLSAVCLEALKAITPKAASKNQQTHFSIQPELVSLRTDERRLHQALMYLLGNASKFTGESGEIGIEVMGDEAGKRVAITVWDTGIGVQQEDFPRLFRPFVQLDASLARQYEGTGLGLALVKQISILLGGDVTVESEFGKGSRFTLTLPWEK